MCNSLFDTNYITRNYIRRTRTSILFEEIIIQPRQLITASLTFAHGRCRIDAIEPEVAKFQRIDEHIDRAYRIALVDPIIKAFRQQRRLLPIRCACRKSNTHIQMMESAEKWRRQNATNGMYRSRQRRVLVD
jgi:hypothetical protein